MDEISSIADFRSPPVVEVVCGVQFENLGAFRSAHIGMFWDCIRGEFPVARDAGPIPAIMEGENGPSASFASSGDVLLPRAQFADEQGGQMVQVQSGRFHYNWEKRHGDVAYWRYSNIRPAFLARWEQFKRFVSDKELGPIRPTQYELSYINHVAAGELWNESGDMADVLPWFAPPPMAGGGAFVAQFAMHAPVPECRGRLHVAGRADARDKNDRRVIALELTVRGAPETTESDTDLQSWMDSARARIVSTFVGLTSAKARNVWEQLK